MVTRTENVNPSEIEKFSRLADEWWDLTGPLRSLHEINPLRLAFIRQYIELKDKVVLDVGCGGGILTEALARHGVFSVMGIDLSVEAIQAAKIHAQQQGLSINYQSLDVEQLALHKSRSYEVITCMELLEHVPDPGRLLCACSQLLKPGGFLFVSTLNKNIKAYLQAIIAAEYILRIVPRHTHEYEKFITPAKLVRLARTQRLNLLGLRGFTYQPFTKKYFFTDSVAVNYLAVFQLEN